MAVWIWPGNRALDPKDFGLVGMVTAFTGILNLFRDFGLSAAAVQRVKVTEEQGSTLFWINLLVGAALTLLMVAMAPAIAAFYREPRLVWVAVVLASGFIVNAAGVQHSAVLQRQMRFTTMAEIDVLSLVVSIMIGIGMALRGYGYWALVATALVLYDGYDHLSLDRSSASIPGKPQRGMDMRSMLRFNGTLTLDGIVVYLAYNLDEVRSSGATTAAPLVLVFYGRPCDPEIDESLTSNYDTFGHLVPLTGGSYDQPQSRKLRLLSAGGRKRGWPCNHNEGS